MLPVIALVGRPNVGKSTLFNRLTRSRSALVADYAGLTRDRQYGEAEWLQRRFIVVDTGGIVDDNVDDNKDSNRENKKTIGSLVSEQALLAIAEADAVLFIVDCNDGLTVDDQAIAQHLRAAGKATYTVANKIDGHDHDIAIAPFFEMGLGSVFPVTATQGRGVTRLLESVLASLPQTTHNELPATSVKGIKIAVVGRPNVGKSTLVNRLLGEERVLTYDLPGTTRDSIYLPYQRDGKDYTLIDTAGIRRRKNIKLAIEKFSIIKALQAIDDANVVVLLVDATEGIVDQDLHLLGHAIDAGRALVVAINKWDGLDKHHKDMVKSELQRRLNFVDFATIHYISALHGTGVGHLYQSIDTAYQSATNKFSTNHLTNVLQMAVSEYQPPVIRGHRIKLRYAHSGGHNPPLIVIHGNQTAEIPKHYTRYLEKTFRRVLGLHGTPVQLHFKTSSNPYAKDDLTDRQRARKRRIDNSRKYNRR